MTNILRKYIRFFSDNNFTNNCRYCKNRVTVLYENKVYTDQCKKFIISNNNKLYNITYELAYDARKDENKCGKKGKFFEDKYFSRK
jgi:hypothetical protein